MNSPSWIVIFPKPWRATARDSGSARDGGLRFDGAAPDPVGDGPPDGAERDRDSGAAAEDQEHDESPQEDTAA